MQKGYPALEHYGRPEDPTEEPVDSTSVSTSTSIHAEKRDSLKELFERRIDYVTDLWRKIESPEIANLPLDEFKVYILQESINLERMVSNSHNLRIECESIMRDIGRVSKAIEVETIRRDEEGSATSDMLMTLGSRSVDLATRLKDRLKNPDFEFVYNVSTFLRGIVLKKTNIEALRSLPEEDDKMTAGFDFCSYLDSLNFESKYGYDSSYHIVSDLRIHRLIFSLKKKISNGENIFDFIRIGPYDIIFTLDVEDLYKVYIETGGVYESKYRKLIPAGAHFGKTPIILLNKDNQDSGRVKIHEQGHNLVEILDDSESLDIHNAVYGRGFVQGLHNRRIIFQELFESGDEEGAKSAVVKYMETAIHNLNGEISADAKNIVHDYPSEFIGYANNLISYLNKYISRGRKDKSSELVDEVFLQIAEEEGAKIKNRFIDLAVKMTTYAHVARRHGLEDEFCSALVLMPDSEKYLKRLLSIKLGGDFDFEKSNKEINFDEIFVGAPDWCKDIFRKYFGPNSVATG